MLRAPAFDASGVVADLDDPARVVVTEEQHARVRADTTVQAMLGNVRLQRMLRSIDSAADRAAALQAALAQNPQLRSLADELLLAAGLARRRPDGSIEIMGDATR